MENNTQNKQLVSKKHYIMIGVNLVLALISVYLFEFWFKKVIQLDTLKVVENFSVVGLTLITYFIAKTYYSKGVLNTLKKIFVLGILFTTIIGLMLLSIKEINDVIYPLSGIFIVSIGFYMLSLSAGTMNSGGIFGTALFFGAFISIAKYLGYIDWSTVLMLSKVLVFLILFIGGTWAEIRNVFHGIKGTNPDGNGIETETNDDNEDE